MPTIPRPSTARAHNGPMRSALLSHRRHARWIYTMRGALYASALYPLTFAVLLLIADRWTARARWQPPHVRSHALHRCTSRYFR